jgi:transposase-like protein
LEIGKKRSEDMGDRGRGSGACRGTPRERGMPWKESRVPDQRYKRIQEYEGGESISALAERYGISRKALYQWIARPASEGGRIPGRS